MTSIKAVRVALASQIETITGLTTAPYMPDIITPPMAALLPGAPYARYGITFGEPTIGAAGMPMPSQVPVPTDLNLNIAIFMSRAPSLQDAQESVDNFLGLEPIAGVVSIPQAILSDPTLGGLVEYCEPTQIVAYGDVEVAGQQYFHGRLAVVISVTQDMGA